MWTPSQVAKEPILCVKCKRTARRYVWTRLNVISVTLSAGELWSGGEEVEEADRGSELRDGCSTDRDEGATRSPRYAGWFNPSPPPQHPPDEGATWSTRYAGDVWAEGEGKVPGSDCLGVGYLSCDLSHDACDVPTAPPPPIARKMRIRY